MGVGWGGGLERGWTTEGEGLRLKEVGGGGRVVLGFWVEFGRN